MQLYFSTHSYRSQSQDLAEERLINCYLEQSPQGAKSQVPVIGAPGIKPFIDCASGLGTGPIWGMHVMNGVLYVVSGANLYTADSAGTGTYIGIIEGNRRVHMSDNGTQLCIVNGLYGYIYNTSTSTLTKTVLGLDSDFSISTSGAGPSSTEVTFTLTGGPASAANVNQIIVTLTADSGSAVTFSDIPSDGDTISTVATDLAATIDADSAFAASAMAGVITVTPDGGTTNLTAATATAAPYQSTLTVGTGFATNDVATVDVEMTDRDTRSFSYKVPSGATASSIATALQTLITADDLLTATVSSNVITVYATEEEITDVEVSVPWITRTDAFPRVNRVCFLDGYFIWPVSNTQQFKISNVNDGTAVFGTGSETTAADDVVSAVVLHQRLYVIGETSIAVYQNTGNADFPFERVPGAVIERGCAAPHSVGKDEETFAWLGNDRVIYAMQGYSPVRISTHGVENRIEDYATIDDAFAFVISWKGHRFYVLTFPTEAVTWIYDATSREWHERVSYDDNADDGGGNSEAFILPSGEPYNTGSILPIPGCGDIVVDDGEIHHCVSRDLVWAPELGLFVKAGFNTNNGGVLESFDGKKWTHIDVADTAPTFLGIAWSPSLEKFAMCSASDIYTSRDAVTWTQETESVSALTRVIWVEALGLFIMGTSSTSTTVAITSADGSTWTARTGTAAATRDFAWSPSLGIVVGVGNDGSGTPNPRIRYSSNGTSWSDATPASGTGVLRAICWARSFNSGNGMFVAVGDDAQDVATSTNGTSWTLRTPAVADQTWLDVAYGEPGGTGIVVAVSQGGKIMSSANGTSWTERTSPAANNINGGWWACTYAPERELFVIAGDDSSNGIQIATSPDGITWTARVY